MIVQIIGGVIFIVIALLVLILVFGRLPSMQNSVIASAYNFLFGSCKSNDLKTDEVKKKSGIFQRCINYVTNERNPVFVIFYGLLVLSVALGYVYGIGPYCDGDHVDIKHNVYIILSILSSVISYIIAYNADNGQINKRNVELFESIYPYDGVLYSKIRYCEHCKIIKPPRSRHCEVTGRCVARQDHFCPWINNCVGAGNYRYFLLFLLVNGLTALYIGYVATIIVLNFANVKYD
ncbi:MAG: putative Palmitoyltransferase SWF1 [Streblomastix strix]|uniref:Palmitoyltransferase n=1 Tax=Streblomastix strix TaxID=222440 RepID=A0A5J4V335_9EUKA|nr:MAG: putative Palmitoyltransferase SWF1 [Streblomastix strix]